VTERECNRDVFDLPAIFGARSTRRGRGTLAEGSSSSQCRVNFSCHGSCQKRMSAKRKHTHTDTDTETQIQIHRNTDADIQIQGVPHEKLLPRLLLYFLWLSFLFGVF